MRAAEESHFSAFERALVDEVKRYGRDAKSIATAPAHWDSREWQRFGEGLGSVAIVYAADPRVYDAVQRNRSTFTNDFAKRVTPFGGRRAEYVSALLILTGCATTQPRNPLSQRIDQLIATPPFDHAVWGIDVEDEAGHVLYKANAHRLQMPA